MGLSSAATTTALHNQPWYAGEFERRVGTVKDTIVTENNYVTLKEQLLHFIAGRRNGGLNIAQLADDFSSQFPESQKLLPPATQGFQVSQCYSDRVLDEIKLLAQTDFLVITNEQIAITPETEGDIERACKVRAYLQHKGGNFQGSLGKLAMTKGVGSVNGDDLHLTLPVLARMVARGQLGHQITPYGTVLTLAIPYVRSWPQIQQDEKQEKEYFAGRSGKEA